MIEGVQSQARDVLMAQIRADLPAADAAQLSRATAQVEAATPEAAAPVVAAADEAPPQKAGGGVEGEAPVAAEETGPTTKTQERRPSRRKSSLKKPSSKKGSVSKTEGDQQDRLNEDSEEEEMVAKTIYPIDPKIQETLRKAWTLFIKKGQKKKTEIAELDIPTVMRSIAINPTETQVKEVIANTISGGAKEMNAADLKKLMMTKGDTMTEQEAALMICNAADKDTGKVYVEEYADVLSKDGIPQPPPDPTAW